MKEFTTELEKLAWAVGLIDGEGTFNVSHDRSVGPDYTFGQFKLWMADADAVERLQEILVSWGIETRVFTWQAKGEQIGKNKGASFKLMYGVRTKRAAYLKAIIDKCYPYFSEKKQGDCDRVLKNLAERGLLGD